MDDGKASREFFADHVAGRTGAERADVRLGPTYGADFGVVDVGDRVLALATDPVFVLRELGVERAAWFAFHICVSDVALSGLPPAHLSVTLNLPPGTSTETFDDIWAVFDREARDLGASITTGHTGTYEGVRSPLWAARRRSRSVTPRTWWCRPAPTRATGSSSRRGRPSSPSDCSACCSATTSRWATTSSRQQRSASRRRVPSGTRSRRPRRGDVTAMHDATERGLANGLHELAAASGVSLAVERERVPVGAGVQEVCELFRMDPWTASSEGTVVLTVDSGT